MLYYRILKICETSELHFGNGVLVTYPWYLNIPFPGVAWVTFWGLPEGQRHLCPQDDERVWSQLRFLPSHPLPSLPALLSCVLSRSQGEWTPKHICSHNLDKEQVKKCQPSLSLCSRTPEILPVWGVITAFGANNNSKLRILKVQFSQGVNTW